MANVNANVTELVKLLDIMSDEQNIMLVGNHGIGKSEILTEYFSAKGMPVIALFLGQMSDPGDLIGIPTKNEVTGKTDFMPPYWFPLDGKPIVLFLDELNRARPEVLQTIMDLALNRKLAGRRLPEGSRIISAVNEGNQYQLTDLDPALVSRFNIINFRPSVQEWLLWARRCKCDPRLLSFIEENAIWLDRDPDAKEGADTGLMKNPDRRGWKRVSDIISGRDELGPIFQKAISSIVGVKAASAFLTSLSSARLLSGKEVLMHLDYHLQTLAGYPLHDISAINDAIYRYLEVEKVSASDEKTICNNLDAYFSFLTKEKKEAAAHFANLYVSQTYPKAVSIIARKCHVLTMSMIVYVRGIQ